MISAENLVRIYKTEEFEVIALQGLDLEVADGELMAIIGNSGSGKSTLLNVIGGLDLPSAGRITVAGRDLLKLSRLELIRYRREKVGFVWQSSARNLIPYLSAVQNVEVPMLLTGRPERRSRAQRLLELVACRTASTAGRGSSRAASSSGWRSPSPWPTNRPWCWPTSPPAASTGAPPRECWRRCARSTASWGHRGDRHP